MRFLKKIKWYFQGFRKTKNGDWVKHDGFNFIGHSENETRFFTGSGGRWNNTNHWAKSGKVEPLKVGEMGVQFGSDPAVWIKIPEEKKK